MSSIPLSYYTIAGAAAGTGIDPGQLSFDLLRAQCNNEHPGAAVLDAVSAGVLNAGYLDRRRDQLKTVLACVIEILETYGDVPAPQIIENMAVRHREGMHANDIAEMVVDTLNNHTD